MFFDDLGRNIFKPWTQENFIINQYVQYFEYTGVQKAWQRYNIFFIYKLKKTLGLHSPCSYRLFS
jgi:hypothetical protein